MKKINLPHWLWAYQFGFSITPYTSLASLITAMVSSLLPAVNVFAIAYLAKSIAVNQSIIPAIILLGIIFGAGGVIRQIYYSISRLNSLRINMAADKLFDDTLANVPANIYMSNKFMQLTRVARQAVAESKVGSQYQAIENIISALITSISLSASLWSFSIYAALISLIVPLPITFAYMIYGKQESKIWPKASEHNSRVKYLQNQLAYQTTGLELASINGSKLIANQANISRKQYGILRQKLEIFSMFVDGVSGVLTAGLFFLAIYFLSLDNGIVSIFAGIVGLIGGISAMSSVGYQIGELIVSLPANSHFRKLIEQQYEKDIHLNITNMTSIKFDNIKVYYDDFEAVKEANLEIKLGNFTALVGENGSGKTSFLKAVMGLQEKAQGSIIVNDFCLKLENDKRIIPYTSVNQDYGRYEISISSFLTMGLLTQPADEIIWDSLNKVEMTDFISKLANGLNTMLGVQWGGIELSGGQWQRLAIARALLSQNKLLYLDEPTSAIDAPTEERIFNHLTEISKHRLILLTSHRVSTLKSAGMIYVMDSGKIIEQGTFQDLIARETFFKQMFQSQLSM